MLNNTLLHLLHCQTEKSKIKRQINPCHAPITIRAVVHLIEHMIQKGSHINTFVQLALQRVVRSTSILKMNVGTKIEKICQKTSRWGYVVSAQHAGPEACPEWKY